MFVVCHSGLSGIFPFFSEGFSTSENDNLQRIEFTFSDFLFIRKNPYKTSVFNALKSLIFKFYATG